MRRRCSRADGEKLYKSWVWGRAVYRVPRIRCTSWLGLRHGYTSKVRRRVHQAANSFRRQRAGQGLPLLLARFDRVAPLSVVETRPSSRSSAAFAVMDACGCRNATLSSRHAEWGTARRLGTPYRSGVSRRQVEGQTRDGPPPLSLRLAPVRSQPHWRCQGDLAASKGPAGSRCLSGIGECRSRSHSAGVAAGGISGSAAGRGSNSGILGFDHEFEEAFCVQTSSLPWSQALPVVSSSSNGSSRWAMGGVVDKYVGRLAHPTTRRSPANKGTEQGDAAAVFLAHQGHVGTHQVRAGHRLRLPGRRDGAGWSGKGRRTRPSALAIWGRPRVRNRT